MMFVMNPRRHSEVFRVLGEAEVFRVIRPETEPLGKGQKVPILPGLPLNRSAPVTTILWRSIIGGRRATFGYIFHV